MKIAVISMIREPWGGSEELWFAMAKQAIAEGHEIIHMSFDFDTLHPKLKELQDMGALLLHRPGYYPLTLSPRERAVRMAVNFVKKELRNPFRQMFRHKPDIVLYNGTCYSIGQERQLLRAIGDGQKLFIIGHLNADDDRGIAAFSRDTIVAAYESATGVYFISERSRMTARRQLYHSIPNSGIIRNPVNMSEVTILPFPDSKQVQWAIVGNLIASHKGHDILFSVLAGAEWIEKNWILNIYGDGPDKEYLKMVAKYYRIEEKVIFHGKVNDIRKVWMQNHVLLMPSHMEGMPLAIVEAMLCGRPCMATDVGGTLEWIEDGLSGWVAGAATHNLLDKALERVWQNKENWASMGVRAHQKAISLYDPDPGKTLLDKLIQS